MQQVVAAESAGPGDRPKVKKSQVAVESEGDWEALTSHEGASWVAHAKRGTVGA
ncbi:MAG TPA: hypothetical protein VK427_05130 [Kofleriaceae bacterium]|nr:hypothetical protein [Kofleriaceae bacterium]